MMNFTVEETNLIDIYKADTRAGKLAAMSDAVFLETAFVPAYPVLYDERERSGFAYGK